MAIPQEPDTQATVRAFYETITAQAASGSPFPTRVVATEPAGTTVPTPSPSPSQSPTPPAEGRTGNGTTFNIPPCPNQIGVNADESDWNAYRGTVVSVNETTFGPEEWQGANDLSGQVRLCWTDAALYFVADVIDDIHVQNEQACQRCGCYMQFHKLFPATMTITASRRELQQCT